MPEGAGIIIFKEAVQAFKKKRILAGASIFSSALKRLR